MIRFLIPVKTVSPNRVRGLTRGAALGHAARKKKEREAARMCFIAGGGRDLVLNQHGRPVVTLTRISAGELDDDNLAASLKHTQDGIADALGIDDSQIAWTRRQRKCARGTYGVEVVIT